MSEPALSTSPPPPAPLAEAAEPAAEDAALAAHTRWRTDRALLLVCLGVLALAALLEVTPTRDGVSLFGWRVPELCTLKRLGSECPGCGLTRSFVLGVRGSGEAFRLHALGPFLLALVAFQVPYRAWRLVRPPRAPRSAWSPLAKASCAALALLYLGIYLARTLGGA